MVRYCADVSSRKRLSVWWLLLIAVSSEQAMISFAHQEEEARQYQKPRCTVCKDGRANVPWPSNEIKIPGIPVEDCGSLEAFLEESSLQHDTMACDDIQSLGSICGCTIPENACRLCRDERTSSLPSKEIEGLHASDFLHGAPPDVLMTCENMEVMLSNHDSNDPLCQSIKQDVGTSCGCQSSDGDENDNNDQTNPTSPSPDELCTLCPNGDSVMYPNRTLDLGDFPVANCQDLSNVISSMEPGSPACDSMRSVGAALCGCPQYPQQQQELACTLCPNGEAIPNPDRQLDWFTNYLSQIVPEEFQSVPLTCGIMEAIVQWPTEDLFQQSDQEFVCMSVQMKSSICGCSPGWRQILLTWSFRSSGILSFLGSASIVYSVLKKKQRVESTYHQLMLGISVFDMIGSVAFVLAEVMVPIEEGFYQAYGNDTTCVIQAFIRQLGMTSIFYNLALGLYFFLVICYGWREHRFKKLQQPVHLCVILVGLALSCAAIPFYGPESSTCYIQQPPIAASWVPKTVIYTVPVSFVIMVLTVTTVAVCWKVYRQQLASRRWSASQNSMSLSRRVFWQSLWYLLGFYLTFPLLFFAIYWPQNDATTAYAFYVLDGFLVPSQGFINALVYFRRLDEESFLLKQGRRLSQRFSFRMSIASKNDSTRSDGSSRLWRVSWLGTVSKSTNHSGDGSNHTTNRIFAAATADEFGNHANSEREGILDDNNNTVHQYPTSNKQPDPQAPQEDPIGTTNSTIDSDTFVSAMNSGGASDDYDQEEEELCIRAAGEQWGIIFSH